MKKLLLCIMLLGLLPLSLWAQETNRNRGGEIRLSREEFEKRQEAYLTKYADLTAEEAAKFFPIYHELGRRKQEISEQSAKAMRESWGKDLDEAKYKEILETMSSSAIAVEGLERSYLDKFREVLSYKKIFKIKEAESRFRQDLVRGMRGPGGPGRGNGSRVPDAPSNNRRQ